MTPNERAATLLSGGLISHIYQRASVREADTITAAVGGLTTHGSALCCCAANGLGRDAAHVAERAARGARGGARDGVSTPARPPPPSVGTHTAAVQAPGPGASLRLIAAILNKRTARQPPLGSNFNSVRKHFCYDSGCCYRLHSFHCTTS